MPTASPVLTSLIKDVMMCSAINSATTREEEEEDNGLLALTRTAEQTSLLLG